MIELDCGDNSCMFATRKGGMRTNGGCRCVPPGATKLRLKLQELMSENRLLKGILEKGCVQADHDGIYAICPVMYERDSLRAKLVELGHE